MKLSENFNSEEFRCRCTVCEHSVEFVPTLALLIALVDIRGHFDREVTITSAKRCVAHNTSVGGSSLSKHLEGIAADIVVDQVDPSEVYKYISELNYAHLLGIGSYNNFTHVDVRGYKARW